MYLWCNGYCALLPCDFFNAYLLLIFPVYSQTRRLTKPRCAATSICARLTPPRTSCPTQTSRKCRSLRPMRCIVPKGRPNRCWCDGVITPREATARRAPRRSPAPWDPIVSMGKVLFLCSYCFRDVCRSWCRSCDMNLRPCDTSFLNSQN